jgi:hypothetical protein
LLTFRISIPSITIALCASFSLYATSASALTMTVNVSKVTVAGVTPHGSVVFFAVCRFVDRTTVTVRPLAQVVVDDDGDGKVIVDVGQPVPWKSILAAIDFTSGQFILGTPDAAAFPLMPLDLTASPLEADSLGALKHLVLSHRVCEMLHVRPAVGAWEQVLADGNKFDDDHVSDGKSKANVAAGIAIAAGMPAAPDKFEKGDVIVVIDRQRMQVWAATVGAKK